MNARAIDLDDALTGQIRGIQDAHPEAHKALVQWGLWSRDRAGIFPSMGVNPVWDQFVHDESEGYADELLEPIHLPVAAKPEKAETPDFNEKEAVELDEFLHSPAFFGGKSYDIRRCLLVAYVTWDVLECQFPDLVRCPPKDFLLRFDAALARIQREME